MKDQGGKLRIRILLDLYSAEIFVNDGEQACSSLIMTEVSAECITFCSEGTVRFDVNKYDIVL